MEGEPSCPERIGVVIEIRIDLRLYVRVLRVEFVVLRLLRLLKRCRVRHCRCSREQRGRER